MPRTLRSLLVVAAAAALAGAALHGGNGERAERHPGAALAVREGARWVQWWREDSAPTRWDGDAVLANRIAWAVASPGVEWGTLQLSGSSEAWRTRLVVVRMDPSLVDLAVAPAFTQSREWTLGDAAPDALVAFDAGQFRASLPWGWVRTGGRELLGPQYAPLAGAVVVDPDGAIRIVAPDSVAAEHRRGAVREAFQSYPMLLQHGEVPAPLRKPGLGVNIGHRDARLALCTVANGRVVVVLTRFDALGETLGRVPFGLTAQEMAAVMGALGCRQAIMLDGGISSQLRLRELDGTAKDWPGTRSVPMGVVVRAAGRER